MSLRLETAEGGFVAEVEPTLPLPASDVVFWGTRVFVRAWWILGFADGNGMDTYREVSPTVVQEVGPK